jgi:hypothetical protein
LEPLPITDFVSCLKIPQNLLFCYCDNASSKEGLDKIIPIGLKRYLDFDKIDLWGYVTHEISQAKIRTHSSCTTDVKEVLQRKSDVLIKT